MKKKLALFCFLLTDSDTAEKFIDKKVYLDMIDQMPIMPINYKERLKEEGDSQKINKIFLYIYSN